MVQQHVAEASLAANATAFIIPLKKPVPYPHLLPPNSTQLERAFGSSTGRITAIPTPIESVWRWDTCPVDLLPWLAWALSVDIWNPDWSEVQKRAIIKESLHLHFKKGTLYAQRRYLSYAGSPLVHAIVPPDKAYPGRSMTDEERQAWLDRFPQIRVFEFLSRGVWTYGAYTSAAYKMPKAYFGDNNTMSFIYPHVTDAADRWGNQAFWWDQGPHPLATGKNIPMRWVHKDKDLALNILRNYEQGFVPTTEPQSFFLGNVFNVDGRIFPIRGAANARIFSVLRLSEWDTEEKNLVKSWAIAPTLRPISVVPEKVAQQGIMRIGINIWAGMSGRWLNPKTRTRHVIKGFLLGYLPPTTSRFRLFDRFYLHDPARLPDGRNPSVYLNHIRLGLPAYHAILMPQIRGRRTLWQADRFVYGATTASDMQPLAICRDAVLRAKSQRDKILLKTAITKTITTKLGIKTTDGFRSGQTVLQV